MTSALQYAYRKDIDGLRALAVLLVVLFHAYPNSLPGGFVGVDVFFVISGYLITGLILDDLRAGQFSIRRFYERRIRRIFPALIVVLAAALLLGWLALLPAQLQELAYQTAASVAFVNNIALWMDVGYFDTAADKKPLLHLWSLGVEEQFYVLAPLFFAFLYVRKKSLMAAVIGAWAVSLFVFVVLAQTSPQSAFYLPHARVWELLAGAGLAQATRLSIGNQNANQFTRRRHPIWLCILSILGLALILGAAIAPQQGGVFQVWPSILAVLGSALVLAVPSSWINQTALSGKVMVWLGKISYPLYLWHWLLLALCHIFEDSKPFFETRNPALIASFVLAWLTCRYVERPIRFGALAQWPVRYLIAPMLLVLGAAVAIWLSGGAPQRAAASVQIMNVGDLGQLEYRAYIAKHFGACTQPGLAHPVQEGVVTSRCASSGAARGNNATAATSAALSATPLVPQRYLILGDSHAEHLFVGLAEIFPERSFSYATREGLPLLSNAGFQTHFDLVTKSPDIKGVVLSASWAYKLRGVDPKVFEADLAATLAHFAKHGKDVYLFDDVPVFPITPERCAYADRLWVKHRCDAAHSEMLLTPIAFAPIVQRVQSTHPRVFYLDPTPFFCTNQRCTMAKAGKLLYRDSSHLGINGSRGLAEFLRGQHPKLFDGAAGL